MLQSTLLLLLAWQLLLLQVDAAVAPFVLRLRVLEGLGNYKVPEGETPLGTPNGLCFGTEGGGVLPTGYMH